MILSSAIAKHREEQFPAAKWSAGELVDYQPYVLPERVGIKVAERFGEFVSFDTFDNCREHGVMVSTAWGWSFCWYEHRNSDSIHIEGCPTNEIKHYGPYGGVSKWDTLGEFWPETYSVVAEALIEMIEMARTIPNCDRATLKSVGVMYGNIELERLRSKEG